MIDAVFLKLWYIGKNINKPNVYNHILKGNVSFVTTVFKKPRVITMFFFEFD